MATSDPAFAILRARIRIALRRVTGQMLDVDGSLADPAIAARTLADWRQLRAPELTALLDQYEQRLSGKPPSVAPAPMPVSAGAGAGEPGLAPAPAGPELRGPPTAPATASGRGLAAGPAQAAPELPAPPPDEPGPTGGGRRYLRGAR